MSLSIILPTYCEQGNIRDLLDAIEKALQAETWEVEILVIDDNSPDGTADAAWSFTPKNSPDHYPLKISCYVRTEERGLASAIRYGIEKSLGDVLIVMDSDFNHDPKMIPQMVKFLEYYDMVSGSRFVFGGGMEDNLRYFYSLLYNLFVRSLLRLQIQDNLSGFYAIQRTKLMSLNFDDVFYGYGEYYIRLLYAVTQLRYRILEVPVYYILRRHGHSKSRFFKMIMGYTACVLKILTKR